MRIAQNVVAMLALVVVLSTACGSAEPAGELSSSPELPIVVATTNILGDVLDNIAGGQFEVVTVMPVGADPHDFQPSAQDVAALDKARAIIANGASFEEGLLDAVEAAEADGIPVFEAVTAVDPITSDDDDHGDDDDDDDHGDDDDDHGDDDDDHGDDDDDHGDDDDDHGDDDDDHGDDDDDHGDDDDDHGDDDDDHGDDDDDHGDDDDDHGDEDEHHHSDAGGIDPHFFTDPARMAVAVQGIIEFLIANVDTIDEAQLRTDGERYIAELTSLDEEVEAMLAKVPEARRVLVTNHEVFGYFADRYDFEVIGTVVPAGSSTEGVSGRRLAELAELLEREGVSVVFADTSSSDELAQTLASEVGEVAIVKLYTESLGDPDSDGATYIAMVRSNARYISDALAN